VCSQAISLRSCGRARRIWARRRPAAPGGPWSWSRTIRPVTTRDSTRPTCAGRIIDRCTRENETAGYSANTNSVRAYTRVRILTIVGGLVTFLDNSRSRPDDRETFDSFFHGRFCRRLPRFTGDEKHVLARTRGGFTNTYGRGPNTGTYSNRFR